jgi:hypothetical protein
MTKINCVGGDRSGVLSAGLAIEVRPMMTEHEADVNSSILIMRGSAGRLDRMQMMMRWGEKNSWLYFDS